MSSTPPPSTSHPKKLNAGTMVPTDLSLWRKNVQRRALDPAQAYALALDADRARERQIDVGYRLYWMSDTLLGTLDVPANPSGYAVLGRHESCDVVLDATSHGEDELAVSLRHVLIRTAALDDGFPVLSVLDLQTLTGFELSDGSRQRSIGATGPIVFRVGTHSIVALPSAGRFGDGLPAPVVTRGELAPHRVAPVRIAELRAEDERSACPPSRITVLPASVDLSRRHSTGVGASPSLDAVPSNGDAYQVVLEMPGRRAGVRFSAADLEHGVLIGRAEKCVDEGLRVLLGGTISRVHVLLIREKGCCHLYDTASLVGTFVNGRRVRCLPLHDAGTTAHLAARGGVTLYWRAL